ncbi:class I SAM-dependent methyltransferase [Aquincola sp. S2]|uniref:Class I SAM-dependent methyltransferase n=1 Tax=Pseudaquabacterium terrae TaxID=2732868 RepID=A0ABX2EB20_9BURK|nr:class I SAM-dependent methyltransferase [Aquabacterium terrae]NRF66068.1 class I SAM-dependent methyltransferase [Aquabacterium terrae]
MSPHIHWTDAEGRPQSARWCSLAGHPAPERIEPVDDRVDANAAYRLAEQGVGLLWRGDFHNARQLLQALGRRLERRLARNAPVPKSPAEAFAAQRRLQAQRAQILGRLLLPFDADHRIPLRRAPDVRAAASEAFGAVGEPYVASLRELQGAIGAHEWRKKGVPIAALRGAIHPHHGVFSPVRGEYVDLVARAPLPAAAASAGGFDIGTGTGVLAAVLARRGVKRMIATDLDARALACAADNFQRLGVADRIALQRADLFPDGRAGLVVCNPPWVPAQPSSALEAAVYDPDSRMLRGYLGGLREHLAPAGEGWLILSDLAEHLGLRSREQLLGWIADAGLTVAGRIDTRPQHRRTQDPSDPLHAARAAEVTSLWRLAAADSPAG